MSDVYHRIYIDRSNTACIVEMQYFDEYGYDQSRFLSSRRFDSEAEAQEYLTDNRDKVPSWVTVLSSATNCLDD